MIVTLVIACALFMETFTGTVITTALPEMARAFGSSPVQLSIGITAYMLSIAIFIPISGWAADRYGARTIFRGAIFIFTLASVLCGLCNTLPEFAAARILQGFGGAMMVPVGRLVLLRSIPRSDYVRAISYVTIPAFIGPVLGPPLGGFITTFLSWRWIFFVNIPIGLLGMVLATRLVPNLKEAHPPPLDWLGFVLTGVSLSCLIYALDLTAHPNLGQDYTPLVLLLLGLAIGVLAVAHARRHHSPLMDLSLLRIPTFNIATSGGFFFRVGAGAVPFLLPILLQVGFGMTAFASGLLTFTDAVGAVAMNVVAPRFIRRFGFRRVLVYNGVLSALCILVCALFTHATPAMTIALVLLVGGFIKSLEHNAFSTMTYADVPAATMSSATSLASVAQQVGLGSGAAFGAILLQLIVMSRGATVEGLGAADIRLAFVGIGCLALCAIPIFLRLAPDAGADVSGHRRAEARTKVAAEE